jgi:hypothetical protein
MKAARRYEMFGVSFDAYSYKARREVSVTTMNNVKHALYRFCRSCDPAVSVPKSQDCGNIQKPTCTNVLKRENGNDAPSSSSSVSLASLISENRT